ncbi:MAG: acetate--CoA ligase family protein [Chloroflexi bacterium]|nr:acetate--CoA ligase family protein [Chloroflexota bacterium]
MAIIGASSNPEKAGYAIVQNLLNSYKGQIFPINPRGDSILGLKSYASVLDVPEEIDLAVVIVKAEDVSSAVAQCAQKGVRGVVIESAGFAEIGEEGRKLQERLVGLARTSGARIWGPNCTGIANFERGLVTSFIVRHLSEIRSGNVSFVSQSGMMAGALLLQIVTSGIFRVSKSCAIGNKADVDECDILEYLSQDSSTEVIAMYLESIKDGRRFMRVAREASRRKPMVVLKAGRTARGAVASISHTGSLAGDDKIVDAAFRQLGITRVYDFAELMDVAQAFSCLPFRNAGDRIAIITITGGGGVVATDLLETSGLRAAEFCAETEARLRAELFPSWAPASNPLDVWSARERYPLQKVLDDSVEILLSDEGVDGLMLLLLGYEGTGEADIERVARLACACGKPVVGWVGGHVRYVDEWSEALRRGNVPTFRHLPMAVRALKAMEEYAAWLRRDASLAIPVGTGAVGTLHATSLQRATSPHREVFGAVQDGRHVLTEGEAKRVLAEYGIPVTREILATSADAAVRGAREIGYPVVMKVVSPDILHKSDVGGVRIGVQNDDEARVGYEKILAASQRAVPSAQILGVSVQEMLPPGVEVIVGVTRDPQFGPVVMFGLGGIFVEVFADAAFGVAPLSDADAEQLIRQTKGYALLKGARGKPPSDIAAIKRVLVAVSRLAVDLDQVQQLDINPLIVYGAGLGAKAADALIVLSR